MTITTVAHSARVHQAGLRRNALFYAMLSSGFLGLTSLGRKRTLPGIRLLAALYAIGFCSVWLACGGNSSTPSNPGTPTGTSAVTVTATAGSLSHQTSITLTVQ